MGRQNEFYKKIHPEQFSDSVLVKKGNLDRDMLDQVCLISLFPYTER